MLSNQFDTASSEQSWDVYLDTDTMRLTRDVRSWANRRDVMYARLSWLALSRGLLIAPVAFKQTQYEVYDAMDAGHYASE